MSFVAMNPLSERTRLTPRPPREGSSGVKGKNMCVVIKVRLESGGGGRESSFSRLSFFFCFCFCFCFCFRCAGGARTQAAQDVVPERARRHLRLSMRCRLLRGAVSLRSVLPGVREPSRSTLVNKKRDRSSNNMCLQAPHVT